MHDVGYRAWSGTKTWRGGRWLVIAITGVRLALRSTWLSRTLVLAWIPALVVGMWFFLYEQSIVNQEYRRVVGGVIAWATSDIELARSVIRDPASVRHAVWSALLLGFFRYPQGVLMLVVVGIVAPRLISYDFRNRGYLLYFSRPIQLAGYVIGKSMVVWTFLALITTLPALLLYVIGVLLSPDWKVIWDTWDLPLRILLASVVLMLPTASVALACSAFTSETRYAVFSWFALWIVGWASFSVLRFGELAVNDPPLRRDRRFPPFVEMSDWEIVSPFHVLGRVQQYVFGLYPANESVWPFALLLIAVTILSLWFVAYRVRQRLTI